MITVDTATTFIERVLEQARRCGAEQAEAAMVAGDDLTVTVRGGDIEAIERSSDKALTLSVYCGGRCATVSTSDTSDAAIQTVIDQALRMQRYTEADVGHELAPRERMAWDAEALPTDFPWRDDGNREQQMAQLAIRCEAAALGVDGICQVEAVDVHTVRESYVYGNTHGFIRGRVDTSHSLSCTAVAERNGEKEVDADYAVCCDAADLPDPERIGIEAGRRAVRLLGGKPPQTATMPILFTPEAARSLIGHLLRAINGEAQYRKETFLLDARDEQLLPEWVQLREDPFIPKALGSRPFDGDGVATTTKSIIADGVLTTYLLSHASARRLGLATTGNAGGITNVLLNGTHTQAQMLAMMDDGIIVSHLMGQGVNGVTGDYSRGAVGFLVRGGRIERPLREMTIAGNLREMYKAIAATGTDIDTRSSIHTGSLLIDAMKVAGQ